MTDIDTQDPRAIAAMYELTKAVGNFVGQPLDSRAIAAIKRVIKDHRVAFKYKHGYEFPHLNPFVLPSIKFIVLYRADLDNQAIRNKLLLLIRQLGEHHASVSAIELAKAVKECWPHYEAPIEEYRKDPKLKMVLQ
jgi:hypothetical protein